MDRIRVIGKIVLNEEQKKRLHDLGTEYIADDNPTTRRDVPEIIHRIANATIVLNTIFTPISRTVLDQCPSLRFIQTWSTGTDHIDLAAAYERGIRIASVRDYATEAISEKTIGAMLLAANELIAANVDAKAGRWSFQGFVGRELREKTLLIIGMGHIGRRVSELACAFGMNVIGTDADTSKAALYEHLSKAAFVVIACPLYATTHHLIGQEAFNLMHDVVLINYARGGIVDESALLHALEKGQVRYAALDVLEEEPPQPGHPLMHHPRVFITPHISWNTEESRLALTDRCIDNIEAFLQGRPIPDELTPGQL